jgi:ABC-2 type transport system permease protein
VHDLGLDWFEHQEIQDKAAMRILAYLIQKEFLQIFRNKAMLPIIFALPIVQLVVLTFAANFELKNIRYVYHDADQSQESARLLARFDASHYFELAGRVANFESGMDALDRNEATLMIRIPPDFAKQLQRDKRTSVMLDVNSIDGQAATLSFSYAATLIKHFNDDVRMEWNGLSARPVPPVHVESRYWFNPEMEYKNLMVPGILALLITMIGMFLSAMNVVREKEIGTIEQINVSPVSKVNFLIGKLLPFWVIAMFELGFGLFVGWMIFDISINGSLALLFAYAAIYMLVVLAMGLWISTFTDTQQQAMFLAWFLIVIFILMSGLFTPIENMPDWAQRMTWLNPVAYMVKITRAVLLKGSTFADIKTDFVVISIFAAAMLSLAVLSYRKRV